MNDLSELQHELTVHQARLTPLGLELPEDTPIAAWAAVGRKLCRADKIMQWWLGDWAAFGLRKYEEERKEALKKGQADALPPITLKEFAEKNGLNYGTLRNYAWVANKVEMSRRRDNVDWSFHAEVAKLPAIDQEKWLNKVEEQEMPVSELRRQMRRSGGERSALESDGPRTNFVSKAVDDLNRFLRDTPEEFWEDEDLQPIWLERLRAAHDRFTWLEQQIKSRK